MSETPDFFTQYGDTLVANRVVPSVKERTDKQLVSQDFGFADTQSHSHKTTGNGQMESPEFSTNLPVRVQDERNTAPVWNGCALVAATTEPKPDSESQARESTIGLSGKTPDSRGGQTNLSGGVESQDARSLTARARDANSACKHVELAKDDLKCSALVQSNNASGSSAPPAQNFRGDCTTGARNGVNKPVRTSSSVGANPTSLPSSLVAAVNGSTVGRGNERQIASLSKPKFDGKTFVPHLDEQRLSGQLKRVRDLMSDSKWRTLSEIAEAVNCSEASASARLRDLRKPKFGLFTVDRKLSSPGLYVYQMRGRGI